MLIWNLANSTRYAAAVTLAADRDGRDLWITILKATFDILDDGEAAPAAEQLPVVHSPLFAGDPMRTSLLADSDIDYAKPGVDVLVQGPVKAPGGKPAREVGVALEVDGRRKFLRVHGERVWSGPGPLPTEGEPFTTMPLVYERAYGGHDPVEDDAFDERNPAGCGYARGRERLIGRPAPQIEYRDGGPGWRPAGLGPVARQWLPRRKLAGTYDETWLKERMPLLPADFDERFFMSAPEDQQFARLPTRALIRLAGMSVEGVLALRLPLLAFGFNVQVSGREVHRRPALRTVLVLPDPRQVVLTFADAMPCTGTKYTIAGVEVLEKEFL
jgi:hypothetical protein